MVRKTLSLKKQSDNNYPGRLSQTANKKNYP